MPRCAAIRRYESCFIIAHVLFFRKSAFVLKAEPQEEWGKRSSSDPRGLIFPRGFQRELSRALDSLHTL